jgi:putative ABC transport system permease protein
MFRQIGAVTVMNLRSVPQRWGTSLVIVVGIAGVVAVLISVLAMATGFRQTVAGSGRADRAIVLRGGSEAELSSSLSRDATLTILDAPGVRKGDSGRPVGSAEAVVIVELPKKGSDTGANVTLRGVGSEAFALRPQIKLVAGRMFQPALHELIVGKSAQLQFQGLDLGSHLSIRGGDWTVVGMFESNGDSHESELLADADTVLSAYQRNLFNSVWVMLDNAEAFGTFKDSLTSNPALSVDVKREPDYYAAQSKQLSTILTFVANFVGGIMAVGAVFGALNTMYSAVSARMVEIATLRAIGFGALPVVISVFAEAVLLAFAGGLIGALLAWLFFNGNSVSTLGGNFTQIVFSLRVSSGLLVLGVVWAVAIGVIGGLFPAIRAARLPIATALRAS